MADILARVRKTNAGPEISIMGDTNSPDDQQPLDQRLPFLTQFIESSHPAEALKECNRTDSHAENATLIIYFDKVDDRHVAPICKMLQVAKWSIWTRVKIGENKFSDAAVQSICGIFKFASPYLTIDLMSVKISDAGVLHIRDALMQTPLTKGFRLFLPWDERNLDLNVRLKVQDSLITAINRSLENIAPNFQQITEAINGYNALHSLWPDEEFDTVNAKMLLFWRYFECKLRRVISFQTAPSEIEVELKEIITEYSDKTSEFGNPQCYMWSSIRNGIKDACVSTGKTPTNWPYVEQKLKNNVAKY
jgi:hypothetical protein